MPWDPEPIFARLVAEQEYREAWGDQLPPPRDPGLPSKREPDLAVVIWYAIALLAAFCVASALTVWALT